MSARLDVPAAPSPPHRGHREALSAREGARNDPPRDRWGWSRELRAALAERPDYDYPQAFVPVTGPVSLATFRRVTGPLPTDERRAILVSLPHETQREILTELFLESGIEPTVGHVSWLQALFQGAHA